MLSKAARHVLHICVDCTTAKFLCFPPRISLLNLRMPTCKLFLLIAYGSLVRLFDANADCCFGSASTIFRISSSALPKYVHPEAACIKAKIMQKSEDGYELSWAVNVMAPFLLTSLLLENITSRIVNVSSISAGSSLDFDNLQQVPRSPIYIGLL